MTTSMRWSLPIAVLVTVASLAGLANPGTYEQETLNWALQAKGQDVGNLLAVVALVTSAVLQRRGSFGARLVWLGTLLYLIYAYIVYAMAVHFNTLFLVYVAVLGLCVHAVLFTVAAHLAQAPAFPGGAARRLAGFTLVAIGVLFAALWLSELVPALLTGRVPQSVLDAGLWVNPIHVIDLSVVLPGFLIAGIGALRGRPSGLFWVAPWLAFSALMGSSIVAAMLLMGLAGLPVAAPPLVMVSLVVVASVVALWRYLAPVG